MTVITLIGMPGVGKSTFGKAIAKKRGLHFVDGDDLIEEKIGSSLKSFIDEKGYSEFMTIEENVLFNFTPQGPTLLATGGSAVYSEKAMTHLKALGKVIHLKEDMRRLEHRLKEMKPRGIANPKNLPFSELYNERLPLYEKYADVTVSLPTPLNKKEMLLRLSWAIS